MDNLNNSDDVTRVCTEYNFKWWHILLPPVEIFYEVCLPRNKTILFIVVVVRFIFYYGLFSYLSSNKYICLDTNSGMKKFMFYLLLLVVCVNIISVIMSFFKSVLFDKNELDQQVDQTIAQGEVKRTVPTKKDEGEAKILEMREEITDDTIMRVDTSEPDSKTVGY